MATIEVGTDLPPKGVPAGSVTRIPTDRYTSADWAALEQERLWPSVWQVACTLDHVSEPGDVFEHRAGWLSVLVVRGEDGELRAFQNTCRHRGNTLCEGEQHGATELRCPFHRWAWDLEGRLREVPSRKQLGPIRNEDLGLLPARVGTWGPLVFVSASADGPSLEEFLEGVPEDALPHRLDQMRCIVTTRTPVPANWKAVADGFSETYHVQGIHRSMLGSMDDVNAPQQLWHRHGVSYQRYGVASPRLGAVDDQVVWDSWIETQGGRMGPEWAEPCPMPEVPEGQTVRDVIAGLLREHVQRESGADLAHLDTEAMLAASQYNLFPNTTVLVWSEMVNVISARPGRTPDEAELVTFLLQRHPDGAPSTTPIDVPVPVDGSLGTVLDQDVELLLTIQRGLHQPGLTELAISSEESRLITQHRALDAWLGVESRITTSLEG
jgi:phenylpropionate dioxygenase-like ring-hydroxylating dioxygenase large terminal subunit